MNKIYIILFFLLTFTFTSGAIVDSTAVIMQTGWSVSDKIRWLNEYSARMLVEDNLIFAEKSALLASKISDEIHFDFGKAKALIHLGQVAYNKKSYAKAEEYFQEAAGLLNASGDKLSFTRAKAMKADACLMENKLDSALSNYKEAYEQFSFGIIDDNLLATIYKRTGDVYCHLDAIDKAANEYDEAIRVYSDIFKNNKRAGEYANNIGKVFLNFEHKEEAVTYFNISQKFFNQIVTDTLFIAENFLNLSHNFEAAGNIFFAISIADKSLKNFIVLRDTSKIIENYAWLGWLNAQIKKNKLSESNLAQAEILITQLVDKSTLLQTYRVMGRAYDKLGNNEKSSKFYSLFVYGSEDLQKQKPINVFNESILNYNDVQDGNYIIRAAEKKPESVLRFNKIQTVFRFLGMLFVFGTVFFAGWQFAREKYKKTIKTKNSKDALYNLPKYKSSKISHYSFAFSNQPSAIFNKRINSETLLEISNLEKSNDAIDRIPIKSPNTNHSSLSTQHKSSISKQQPTSPKEILDSISGHIEQIKRLQKILFDKQLSENFAHSFETLKTTTYELQVLIDSIHTSMQNSNSTILNTETFFSPNDVINYVKEQLVLPSRIPVSFNLDARLPSLLIGNGMRLSQIIIQSIKGLSKPMIEGAVRVNLSRSEIIGDEMTVKLDIEAYGNGFIFDRMEKIMNSDQLDERSADESEAALLFVKKLVRSKNDEIYIQRNGKKTILSTFLTYEIPIPNFLSMTDVHPSLLPKTVVEKQISK